MCPRAHCNDECIIVIAKSPKTMFQSIPIVLDVAPAAFCKFALNINCYPDKSEAFLCLHGKKAAEFRESLRRPDGRLKFEVPNSLSLSIGTLVP